MIQIQPCLNFEGKTCVLVKNQILQFFLPESWNSCCKKPFNAVPLNVGLYQGLTTKYTECQSFWPVV
jgi:hypothetical protein